MKREEAIKILKRDFEPIDPLFPEVQMALDMAIEALQTDIVRCKDCQKRGSDDCPMFSREWRTIMNGNKCVDDFIFHDLTEPGGFCNYGKGNSNE